MRSLKRFIFVLALLPAASFAGDGDIFGGGTGPDPGTAEYCRVNPTDC